MQYKQIFEDFKDSSIQYETQTEWSKEESPALKMSHLKYPVSIKEKEAETLINMILENNLKSGFEVATGFGISATMAGLAFKKTGGRLITVDAYIEEVLKDPNIYKNQQFNAVQDSDGFKSVKQLLSKYDLNDIVTPVIGVSPRDIESIFSKYGIKKLDYAFIDGGHWDEAVTADLNALYPYLSEGAFVFFHDVHCLNHAVGYAERLLKGSMNLLVAPPNGWNLSYIRMSK